MEVTVTKPQYLVYDLESNLHQKRSSMGLTLIHPDLFTYCITRWKQLIWKFLFRMSHSVDRVDTGGVPAEDKLTFNLLAEGIGVEFDNLMDRLSERLTCDGQECGAKRTTFKDHKRPIILEIQCEASAKIMITRGNGYSYAFYAAGGWRQCSDCSKHYVVVGATEVGFTSSYKRFELKEIGPRKIWNSVLALASNSPKSWQEAFLYLCCIFIESVRMVEFGNFVRSTLVNAEEQFGIYSHLVAAPEKVRLLPHKWGKASDALRRYYLGQPPMTHWSVDADVLRVLRLSTIGEAPVIQGEQDEQRRVQNEINLCLSNVRIVMHG